MYWNHELPPYIDLSVTPGKLEEVINEAWYADVIGIDTETTGLVNWKERVLGWSIAFNNKRVVLTPEMLSYWQPLFAQKGRHWALANAKFDMHMLANMGYVLEGKCMDIQVADSLLFEEERHALKLMAQRHLGWSWQSFEDLVGKIGKNNSAEDAFTKAWTQHHDQAASYMACDAWGTLELYRYLKRVMENTPTQSMFADFGPRIRNIWDLFYNVEVPFTSVLWKVERAGIRIDENRLNEIAPKAEQELKNLERACCKAAGRIINPNSSKDLCKYFFEEKGYVPHSFTKGGKSGEKSPKTDEHVLQEIAAEGDELAPIILEYKANSKLLSTYIYGFQERKDPRSRLHCTLNQDTTRTGRLSAKDPNLFN